MGKMAHAGPVYGAKGGLFSVGPVSYASGTTGLVGSIVVPPYETWFLTEVFARSGNATSNSSLVKTFVKIKGTNGADPNFPTGNAGTAGSVTGPTSTAAWNVMNTLTTTPGEYEGYAAPANSTIRLVSSGTVNTLFVSVNGYIRFVNSTRAE